MINYELPNIPESYVHRIGRTARAGAEGIAISFCDREEVAFLRDIEKTIRLKVPVITDHPFIEGTPVPSAAPGAPRESRRPPGQSARQAPPAALALAAVAGRIAVRLQPPRAPAGSLSRPGLPCRTDPALICEFDRLRAERSG
ncbi:MAG: DEAD/DEAH box helicase [Aliidongia sp.]